LINEPAELHLEKHDLHSVARFIAIVSPEAEVIE
jgi:hypothetical protein